MTIQKAGTFPERFECGMYLETTEPKRKCSECGHSIEEKVVRYEVCSTGPSIIGIISRANKHHELIGTDMIGKYSLVEDFETE